MPRARRCENRRPGSDCARRRKTAAVVAALTEELSVRSLLQAAFGREPSDESVRIWEPCASLTQGEDGQPPQIARTLDYEIVSVLGAHDVDPNPEPVSDLRDLLLLLRGPGGGDGDGDGS